MPAATADTLAWRRVNVRGSWDRRHHLLLDNQIVAGRAGYFVYTPLRIEGCHCAVLVNRGWIALGPDRQSLPDLDLAVEAPVAVSGIAAPPPPAGLGVRADLADFVAPGVLRVQRLDPASAAKWLGMPVLPLTVRLDPAAPDGYVRNWAPPPGRVERHMAYAAQWFLMALLVIILLAGLNLRRSRESKVSLP